MKKSQKNGNQDKTLYIIVLITAILNLIEALIEFIGRLNE